MSRGTGTTTCATWSAPARTSASSWARSPTPWPGAGSTSWWTTPAATNRCSAWPRAGWPCNGTADPSRLQEAETGRAGRAGPSNRALERRGSVEDAGPQRARDRRQLLAQQAHLGLVGGHVDHHVADLGVGAQELAVDVDRVAAEDLVDLGQHAGDVAVDVQQAQAALVLGQGDLGEVHRRQGAAVVAVAHQLGRHLDADVLLRLKRAATDVRGQDHVVEAGQRRDEGIVVALGLDREHV